ncbi:MAG: bifunctional biotin--[acetyl-CoA-carboxylase] ligase/biotin operon repressor BirA [gamma proteobacterium symbiont of Bathyaustriella thionipta]|nr:bifunctional biotin--[acetyl-CoA-carboxylase] ligase/biotin operon repressor BirA [gamma proteobacterium symbiont of Bathyaustriella thionipta]
MLAANKIALLQQLATGGFCSGERLAQQLKISRSSVWKHIQQLQQQTGLRIDAVRGRGYRLSRPLELLDNQRIKSAIEQSRSLQIEIFHQLDSTNHYLMRHSAAGLQNDALCLTEQQLAGRGRRGRSWCSPFGTNIYLSYLHHFHRPPAAMSGFSLVAALSVYHALETLGVQGISLKWPNDIMTDRGKLAGVLLEMTAEPDGPCSVVTGIGLNTRLPDEIAQTIDQPWDDLHKHCRQAAPGRNALVIAIVNALRDAAQTYDQYGLEQFRQQWLAHDRYHQKRVTVTTAAGVLSGQHSGVSPQGGLLLATDKGVQEMHGGEVSLRAAS